MRFLIRLVPQGHDRAAFTHQVRALARSVGAEARNPKWTTYGALEIDIFANSKADLHLFLGVVEPLARLEFSREDLNEAPAYHPKEELMEQARSYFNSERYWESHEILESIWKNSSGDEKLYLQGIILVCAAFVHEQKGEYKVAFGVLRRAEKQLNYGAESYYGVDVALLRKRVKDILGDEEFRVFRI
jgi:uncharacterized protein